MNAPQERYLDAAATSPLRPEARAAIDRVYGDTAANPSSVHAAGFRAAEIVARGRATVAQHLGSRTNEVVFTSGGTEANNLAVIGLALGRPRGKHVLTTQIEHPSVIESCRFLERVFGFEITMLPVDRDGRVNEETLVRAVRQDTTLVSIGLANAEVGSVQQVPALASIARQAGALFHTDAVQAASSLPVRLDEGGWPGENVDACTVASHKFGGPQGMGALLVRAGVVLEPLLHGGGQESGRRSGTENVAGIAGFAAAVAASNADVGTRALALMESRDALVEQVVAEVPGARATGHRSERLPGHASFVFDRVSGESLLVALDAGGIAVSSGSACAAGYDAPSPVLLAMGYDPEIAQSALRFTMPAPLSPELIDRIVTILRREVSAALVKG